MFRFDLLNQSGRMPNVILLNITAHTQPQRALQNFIPWEWRFSAIAATSTDIFLNYFCIRVFLCLFLLLHPQYPVSKPSYMTFLKLAAFSPHSRLSIGELGLLSLKVGRNNPHICFCTLWCYPFNVTLSKYIQIKSARERHFLSFKSHDFCNPQCTKPRQCTKPPSTLSHYLNTLFNQSLTFP